MSRCIKLTFSVKRSSQKLLDAVQEQAHKCKIEGFVMAHNPQMIKIVACGMSRDLDNFLDHVDDLIAAQAGDDVVIDPFLKDKDYRGVFRIMN